MPIQGILNTAHSLALYQRWQEITAHNVANANTDAFKVDRLAAMVLPGSERPVPVQTTDLQQGTFRETGRPLDVALDGPGFLVVETPQGERLTRGGSLRLDPDGRLVDSHGAPLLDERGPLVVSGSDVTVQSDGTVVVDGAVAGRLRLETVDDPGTLLKEGYGRFATATPTRAVPEGTAHVRQGVVEEPNFDSLMSMVDLVTIQRAYAANADALKAIDSVLGTVTNEVGKV
jgi:flagellar basal-body rod protein FlgF